MSKFVEYSPQAVTIPPDIAACHNALLRNRVDSYPKEQAINGGYVLLHDVFRTASDDKIIAIGTGWRDTTETPIFDARYWAVTGWAKTPQYKLSGELNLLEVTHNDEPIGFQYRTLFSRQGRFSKPKFGPLIGIYEMEMTPAMRLLDKIHLKLRWRDFEREVILPRNDFRFSTTDMTLHTMQRNNHPLWIADWCNYYYRQHGVRRIVIYNNLDSNPTAIAEVLRKLPDDVETLLIDWPHRHNYEIYFNLSQVVGLNHCPMLLGGTSKYYLNFDVDEYVINKTGLTLSNLLDKKMGSVRQTSSLFLSQYKIPNFEDDTTAEIPRVWHFKYRSRKQLSDLPQKTISRYGRFDAVWQHSVMPKWPRFLLPLWRFNPLISVLSKIHILLPFFRFPLERTNRLYFNHYQAIGSNWNRRRPNSQKILNNRHYTDDSEAIKKSQIY